MTGVLLTDGSIVTGDPVTIVNATLTADSGLYSDPPEGYNTGVQMAPVAGTWERQPSP